MSFMGASGGRVASFPTHLVLNLVLQEVRANASDAEEQAFFQGVGQRLATLLPISTQGDPAAIAAAMNEIWQAFMLGKVTIDLEEEGLRIRHHLTREQAFDQHMREFPAVLPHILHGAYDGWMRELGSRPPLRTVLVNAGADMIEYKHGL